MFFLCWVRTCCLVELPIEVCVDPVMAWHPVQGVTHALCHREPTPDQPCTGTFCRHNESLKTYLQLNFPVEKVASVKMTKGSICQTNNMVHVCLSSIFLMSIISDSAWFFYMFTTSQCFFLYNYAHIHIEKKHLTCKALMGKYKEKS